MLEAIHHASTSAGNLERLTEFYRDVLGLSSWFPTENRGGTLAAITGMPDVHMQGAFLRLEKFYLLLWQYLYPKGKKTPLKTCNVGSSYLTFQVDDIQEVYRRYSQVL